MGWCLRERWSCGSRCWFCNATAAAPLQVLHVASTWDGFFGSAASSLAGSGGVVGASRAAVAACGARTCGGGAFMDNVGRTVPGCCRLQMRAGVTASSATIGMVQ